MSSDIRISVEFWNHHKTGRLIRDAGIEGVRSLQILWCWAAVNKPSGILTGMDDLDIEFSADWRGEPGKFFSAIDGRWIDVVDGSYVIHDWLEHNPWAHDSDERSNTARLSRFSREDRVACEILRSLGVTGITREEYQIYKRSTNVERTYYELNTNRSTPTPTPTPTPNPVLTASLANDKKIYEPPIPDVILRGGELYDGKNGEAITTPFD